MKLRILIILLLSSMFYSMKAQITFRKFSREYKAHYYIEKIIDARADTSTFVGYSIDTLAKTITDISFEKSVSTTFKECLDFAIDKENDAIPLIIRINYLEYGKRIISNNENGVWVYYDFDFFIKEQDRYIQVRSEQKICEGINPSGIDNVDFPNLTWSALQEMLHEFIYKNALRPLEGVITYSDSTIIELKNITPVFSDVKFVDGIYSTYQEFLSGKPSYPINEKNKLSRDRLNFYYIDEEGREKKVKRSYDLWGIVFNGEPLYAQWDSYYGRYFYAPLEPLGTAIEAAWIAPKFYVGNFLKYKWKNSQNLPIGMNYTFSEKILKIFHLTSPGQDAFFTIGIPVKQFLGSRSHRYLINAKTGKLEESHFININP